MEKSEVVAAVCAQLERDMRRMLAAARAIEAVATDPENRAENKYDTRGLEASYLAAGQGEQVEALAAALKAICVAGRFPPFSPEQRIGAGALVTLESGGERDCFLLAPAAGGVTVAIEGVEVTVLAPGAPLRGRLEGRAVGDRIADPAARIVNVQ